MKSAIRGGREVVELSGLPRRTSSTQTSPLAPSDAPTRKQGVRRPLAKMFPRDTSTPNLPRNYWATKTNHRSFAIQLGEKFGIREGEFEPWYKLTNKKVIGKGGSSFLYHYGNSLRKALKAVFPEHSWDFSKFVKKSRSYWKSDENRRKALLEVGEKLGIGPTEYEKWYAVKTDDVHNNGGRVLIEMHNSSVSQMLMQVFPEHKWEISRFVIKPKKYWTKKENQRKFMAELSKSLNLKDGDFEAWYNVTNLDFIGNGGAVILDNFGGSVSNVLKQVFPEHKWDPKKFGYRPRHHWSHHESQRDYFLDLGKKLGIKEGNYDAWYKVKYETIKKNGGSGLLLVHENSIVRALQSAFPEHKFLPSKFVNKPKHFWAHPEHQRAFVNELGRLLGVKEGSIDGWYKLSVRDLIKHGGAGIRSHFTSLYGLLSSVYPDYDWKPWKFTQSRNRHSKSLEVVTRAVRFVEEKLGLKAPAQWYRVSKKHLQDLEVYNYFRSIGGMAELLRQVYPETTWDESLFFDDLQKKKKKRGTTTAANEIV